MAVWYSLWTFAMFFPDLVFLDQEKSGTPGLETFWAIFSQTYLVTLKG
jgi:hypothetical protein